jgi:hypothetical protein
MQKLPEIRPAEWEWREKFYQENTKKSMEYQLVRLFFRRDDLPPLTDLPGTLGALQMAPDGAALDAEGAVWFADAIGQRVVRMAAGGRILETRSTAPMGAFACALGGPDRRTLFVCVAPDFHEHARRAAREAAVWATPVAVPGAGWP